MTTTVPTPEWLKDHDGELKPGLNGNAWLVLIGGRPAYRLVAPPAKNQFSCAVTQTVNGRRLDKGTAYPTSAAALQGGLEELRQALGW
jgi:hypothetical protein